MRIEVLRHRLDDHVGAMKSGNVRGPADPREHLLQPAPVEPTPADLLLEEPAHVRERAAHRGIVALLDPHHQPGTLRGHEGDAPAHEPAAEQGELVHRPRLRRAVHPGVLLQRGGGEEQLAEPRADLGDQQLAEGAGLCA